MKVKQILAIALVLVWMLAMTGVVGAADTIKIGILGPISNDVGEGEVNAAKMAIEVINKAGGISGKKVELFIEDDENKPEKAVNGLKKLVMVNQVHAVLGGHSSGVVLSLMDHIARYRIPFISTGSSSNRLTENVGENYDKYKYFFRIMVNETGQADGMIDLVLNYLRPKLNVNKIAVMAEDAKWTEFTVSIFLDAVKKAGITVTDYFRFPIKETDFAPIISRAKASNIDFLIDVSSIADGSVYINQWYDMQGPPIGGCNTSAGTDEFWDKTNGKCLSEIIFMYGAYPIDLTPTTRKFWNDYLKRYSIVARYSSGFTYDGIMVVAEAIKKGGSTKPDDLVKALEGTSYPGVSGLIEFDKKTHNVLYGKGRPTLVWLQWQGKGKRVAIHPKGVAEGDLILPKWWKTKSK
jgi:branched-chain amino acid transport system substrate-binding protein